MGKLFNFIIMTVGLAFMVHLSGISAGTDFLLDDLGFSRDAFSLTNSAFYGLIILALTITVSAIIIGTFSQTSPEYLIRSGIAVGPFLIFISVYTAIIGYSNSFSSWVKFPIWVIFGLFGVGLIMSLVEWVLGSDA